MYLRQPGYHNGFRHRRPLALRPRPLPGLPLALFVCVSQGREAPSLTYPCSPVRYSDSDAS